MSESDDETVTPATRIAAGVGERPAGADGPVHAVDTVEAALSWSQPAPVDSQELPLFDPGELENEGQLGGGGMGIVELSMQRSLQRRVAVKRLRLADESSEVLVQSLLREAIHTGALEHPGIVPVYALGRTDSGAPLMVMKRVEGVRWSDLIEDPSHDAWRELRGDQVQQHVRFTIQLCRALEFAHSRGLIHRDVKPSNVLIGEYGEVMLLDWGISIRIEEIHARPAGTVTGTPLYMAPEMLGLGPRHGVLGPHTDVYLLAGSLFHALNGQPPHRGVTLAGLLASVVERPPPVCGSDVPLELASICRKALATHPRDRYSKCSEFRQALEDYLEHRASVALAAMAAEGIRSMRAELEEEGGSVRAREHFAAARVGLEQALRAWPANPTALAVLGDAVELMARAHVESRELDAARAMVTRLGELDSERAAALEVLIEGLEAELARADAGRERLQRIDEDLDASVGQRERTLGLRWLTAFVAVVATAMIAPKLLGYSAPPMIFTVASFVLVFAGAGTLFFFRATFLGNRINRLMASVFASVLAGITVHRLYALIRGDTVEQTVTGDGVVVGVVLGFAAVVLQDKRLLVPTVLFFTFTLIGARWPDVGHVGMGVSTLLSVALLAFTKRPSGAGREK